jgi:acyl-CoA thioester hydrolase
VDNIYSPFTYNKKNKLLVAEPIFAIELKVRDYECDTQGHVNNANYQHYFEVARHEFLEKTGLNFHNLHLQGVDAVVSSVHIRYKIPLIGMDKFKCTISKIDKVSVKYIFHQEIIRTEDNALCAKAKIEVVNLVNGKLSEPTVFNEAFADFI